MAASPQPVSNVGNSTLARPEKAALGSNVRLQTWFFLLGLPTTAVLMVLLGGAVWGTRLRVDELVQLKHDGASIAEVESLIMTLAVELRETATLLAPDDGAGAGASKHTLKDLAAAWKTTDAAF
ncbi:MAG TPA: hypothetical protein VGO75_06920, partial [Gemmatimonadaceae bacterium]|nr:hypothetical protein [Gemmatimonadaceae bacterium]